MQTKTTTDNTIYDISNILINGETGNSFVIKSHNSGSDVNATSISVEEGKFIDSNSHLTANTKMDWCYFSCRYFKKYIK